MDVDVIYNADCMEGLKDIPDKAIDMILCDLPYGTTNNQWDSIIPIEPLWEQYNRIIKDNGAIVLTAQMPFSVDLINGNRKNFRYEWIWQKTLPVGFLNSRKMPLRSHEQVLVFYKELPTYNAQGVVNVRKFTFASANSSNYGKNTDYYEALAEQARGSDPRKIKLPDRFSSYEGMVAEYSKTNWPRDIITFRNIQDRHPTAKPVDLFEYLIRTYTNEAEIVLDNCMGGGTTAIACINSNRHYIGWELNKEYYDYAIQRIKAHKVASEDKKKQKKLEDWE